MWESGDATKFCLTIAGSDPSGGAGLQADLRVFARLGVSGLSAVTAVTAQNSKHFFSMMPVPAKLLGEQLMASAESAKINAIKIGMLATLDNIKAVEKFLASMDGVPVVLDPVFDATTGHPLLEEGAREYFIENLMPLATFVTPNLGEASRIAGIVVSDVEAMKKAAKTIFERAAAKKKRGEFAVVVKGGHLEGDAIDVLYRGEAEELRMRRVNSRMHGTGCIYSSALAAYFALGSGISRSARLAKEYVSAELLNLA